MIYFGLDVAVRTLLMWDRISFRFLIYGDSMKIKQFAAVALFGMSISTAQATIENPTLTFDSSFFGDFSTQEFRFVVDWGGNDSNETRSVSMWSDTLTDGLDNHLTLFMHNASTGLYDYVAALGNGAEIKNSSGLNATGFNVFNVAIKNGFVLNDPNKIGVSDEGATLSLTQGTYLLVNSSQWFQSIVEQGEGSTFEDGYVDAATYFGIPGDPSLPTWTAFPFGNKSQSHAFKVFVDGDVAVVSSVPLPSAVWLFGSAVAGFGAISRRKQMASAG